jgi:hypothetical protein
MQDSTMFITANFLMIALEIVFLVRIEGKLLTFQSNSSIVCKKIFSESVRPAVKQVRLHHFSVK